MPTKSATCLVQLLRSSRLPPHLMTDSSPKNRFGLKRVSFFRHKQPTQFRTMATRFVVATYPRFSGVRATRPSRVRQSNLVPKRWLPLPNDSGSEIKFLLICPVPQVVNLVMSITSHRICHYSASVGLVRATRRWFRCTWPWLRPQSLTVES